MERTEYVVKGIFKAALLAGLGLTIGKNLGELVNTKLNEFLASKQDNCVKAGSTEENVLD